MSGKNEADIKNINVVLVGHVDHGKSTVLGRMLADSDALPKGKIEQVSQTCSHNSKPFEYAFLIDALKDEQEQGITIDSARVFFHTEGRNYIVNDAPGHIGFLKNMVTGASRAQAAFLVVDASEGVMENSKRHVLLLAMLGVKQVVVVVNKMDLVEYDEKRFAGIVSECKEFLSKIQLEAEAFIPVSGTKGDNIVFTSDEMSWYNGSTVLEAFEGLSPEEDPVDKPFRMPVQGVYKFTDFGDDRRIIAGDILTGRLAVGDEILFCPSGKKSKVKTIEAFNKEVQTSSCAGEATGLTLTEQIYVKRGEMAVKVGEEKPHITTRIKASLFWLSKSDMVKDKEYTLKLGTSRVSARIETINKVFDALDIESSLPADSVKKNMFAECTLRLSRPLVFDLIGDIQKTSRFVIVDEYDISGGGIIQGAVDDEQSWVREKVLVRDYKWIKSAISANEREEKYGQHSALVFITGEKEAGRKTIAREFERKLFNDGRVVYYLGIGNILYGVDADIKGTDEDREEHIRRLAEVAHIMLEAGIILIITAIELTQEDMDLIKTAIGQENAEVVWVGNSVTTDIKYDLKIEAPFDVDKAIDEINALVQRKGRDSRNSKIDAEERNG